MIWIIGAILMVIFGALGVFIGLYFSTLLYAILGGILLVVGILWLVAFKRARGPLSRNF